LHLFQQTLSAIDVETVVRQNLKLGDRRLIAAGDGIELDDFNRILIIALGKASVPMARAAEEVLGEHLTAGVVVANAVLGSPPRRLPCVFGSHPLPNRGSLTGAETALRLLREHDAADTLVIFLISGGGSAMFEKPIDDRLSLADLQAVNRVLVNCGAVIGEMNVVRRYLSAVKGGRLAAAAPRSRQVSLYLSDVNADDLSTVSSGPTLASAIARQTFDEIVARYDLTHQFPPHVAALLNELPDLPQPESTKRCTHHLLLDNRRALQVAQQFAESQFNCIVEVAEDFVEGEVQEMARIHLERLIALRERYPNRLICLLSGGEVICPVRGDGQGGRNQEFVLRAALLLHEQQHQNIVVLSAGTDGIDGHSPADGALADEATIARAAALGLSATDTLQRSDSFTFLNKLGDALITGPTGNNVRDLRLLLAQ
jgi:hydroxypyruvate reductase